MRVRRKRPFVDHLVLALSRYQADAGNRLAAAVSYYGFLSFFPARGAGLLDHRVRHRRVPDAQQNLIDQINTFLPGLADKLNIASIGNVKVASGIIGIVGLLITGLAWVNALREAMRTMWHHNIQVGNIVVRWLHDTFILLGLGLALLLTTAVSGAASAGIGLVLDALDLSGSTVATYLLRIVSLLLAVAADTVIYAFLFTRLPRVAVPMRRVLRGALFAAIGLELIKVGAAYLIPQKVSNPIYLTFGVLFGLLIWINIVSRWSLLAAAWTVTEPYDADVAPSGTASVDMAQKAGIPEEYASSDPAAVLTTFGGGVPSPLYGAIQAKSPPAAAEPGFGAGPASGAGPGLGAGLPPRGAGPGLPGVRDGACLPGVRDAAIRPSAVWQGGAHAPHHSPYGYAPARPGCLDRCDLARLPAPACRRPRAQDVLLRGPRRAYRRQPGDGGGARAHRSADQAHASVRGRRVRTYPARSSDVRARSASGPRIRPRRVWRDGVRRPAARRVPGRARRRRACGSLWLGAPRIGSLPYARGWARLRLTGRSSWPTPGTRPRWPPSRGGRAWSRRPWDRTRNTASSSWRRAPGPVRTTPISPGRCSSSAIASTVRTSSPGHGRPDRARDRFRLGAVRPGGTAGPRAGPRRRRR